MHALVEAIMVPFYLLQSLTLPRKERQESTTICIGNSMDREAVNQYEKTIES